MQDMKNIQMDVEGTTLVIRIDLTRRFQQSQSGKSVIVASTGGNVGVPGVPDVKLGVNVYVPTGR